MRLYQLLTILCIFVSTALYAKNEKNDFHRKDTIFSKNRDTTIVRTFKKDGKVKWEEYYVKEKLVNSRIWYYRKRYYGYYFFDMGSNRSKIDYAKEYYLNRQLRIEGTLSKNKKHGKYKTYYQNGNTQCDCNYRNGRKDSLQIIYFENGQEWTSRIYRNGKIWEVLSNYDINGNPMEKGTLKNGNGTLFLYDEKGKLIYIEHYKKGKRVRTKRIRG